MEKLGHYRIEKQLGRGAMGVVYRAVDERLDRTVALKVLRLNLADDERAEYAARLQQEAKSAARLNHPGIITMFDCGDAGDNAFLAMEYVDGKSLQDLMERKRLSVSRVTKVADQLFAALAYAHEHGVVHRDIKPANLMLTPDGRLKITDFGIAQLPASDLTRTGTLIGSPRHMSPEQVQGKKVDGRADIFSAGIVLYEMLTGEKPFDGEHVASIAYRILHEAPCGIQALNPDVPDELAAVVMRCLEKEPDNRFQTARDARTAIRALMGKSTVPSAPVPVPVPVGGIEDVEGPPTESALIPSTPANGSEKSDTQWRMVNEGMSPRKLMWIGGGVMLVLLVGAALTMRGKSPTPAARTAERPVKTEIMEPQGAKGLAPATQAAVTVPEGTPEAAVPAAKATPVPPVAAHPDLTPTEIAHAAARRAGTEAPAGTVHDKGAQGEDRKESKAAKPAGPHKPLPIIPIPPS